MKYYILKNENDPQIVGAGFPQAYDFIKEYDPEGENALFSLYKYRLNLPDYEPNIDGIKLSGRSKKTDFISNPFNALIMSPQAKSIFDHFKVAPTHRFYKMGLYIRKVKFDYWWLDLKSDQLGFVDYPNTTFIIEGNGSNSNTYVEIADESDYLKKRENILEEQGIYGAITGVKIQMNKQFDRELDLFKIGWLDASTYISERLVEAIHSNGLTGWRFLPADHLIVD